MDCNKGHGVDDHRIAQSSNPTPDPSTVLRYNGTKSLRLIENIANRQVTFCKRRTGLFRKAYELSVLCDAKIGVIVFSPPGRLSQFCSPETSMLQILERYKRSHVESNLEIHLEQQAQYWRHETLQLQKEVENLKNWHGQIMGECSVPLSIEEIENLESTLGLAKRKLNARKDELRQLQTLSFAEKGNALSMENEILRAKFKEVVEECRTSSISNDSSCDHILDTNLTL